MGRELRDLKALLDRCTYRDSYGVYGSEFVACRICERDTAGMPGVPTTPDWHEPGCPVPRLLRKYEKRGAPTGEQQ